MPRKTVGLDLVVALKLLLSDVKDAGHPGGLATLGMATLGMAALVTLANLANLGITK